MFFSHAGERGMMLLFGAVKTKGPYFGNFPPSGKGNRILTTFAYFSGKGHVVFTYHFFIRKKENKISLNILL
jgi:hypothetical protein